MTKNIVKLETNDSNATMRGLLSDAEYDEVKELRAHPATISHVLLSTELEVLDSENVDETNAAALANVFEICGTLTDEIGQKQHVATVFEGRDMEITCKCLENARLVLFRAKGNRKIGG